MGVSLASLKTFEKDGKWLGESIQSWLDKEWIVMDFHRKLGLEVENIYIQQRSKGVEDLGEMLMEVGSSLELYDMKEAFVSAWDVGNKVSDLLMVRLDRELCSCMGDMSQFQSTASGSSSNIGPISSKNNIAIANEMQFYGSSEFNRYKLLRDFLDGDLTWQAMEVPIAICMGFRTTTPTTPTNTATDIEKQYQQTKLKPSPYLEDSAPCPWEGLQLFSLPDFSNLEDSSLARLLELDIPEDEKATDVALEALVGTEMYKVMNRAADTDAELRRKLLLGRWMYIQLCDDSNVITSDKPGSAAQTRNEGWLSSTLFDEGDATLERKSAMEKSA